MRQIRHVKGLVDNYKRTTALEKNTLHPNQHAHRAGSSTVTSLYSLVTDIGNVSVNGEVVLCAALVPSAFDNTSHSSVTRAQERR